jgi:hypothetical protein
MNMTRPLAIASLLLSFALPLLGQAKLIEGTSVRIRLEQELSSASAEVGQPVQFTVTEDIKSGNVVVIPQGAIAEGKVTVAQPKRRMGRAGKLDFSVERVRTANQDWIPLRYSQQKKTGQSSAVSTGLLTAGVAVLFLPAAPFMLLRHGKDVDVHKGTVYEVFTDQDYIMPPAAAASPATPAAGTQPAPGAAVAGGTATVHITSPTAGADISVDGNYMGSTPATLQLAGGNHKITVSSGGKSWERLVTITGGSEISLVAVPQ